MADELGARPSPSRWSAPGVYGWPKADAIACALEALRSASTSVHEARLVAFDAATYDEIRAAL